MSQTQIDPKGLLKKVIFPVNLEEIFVREAEGDPTDLLEQTMTGGYRRAGNFRAVVDKDKRQVLSIVSPKYRLVTNERALELGKQCFRQVFDDATLEGMEVYNIVTPGSRSFCHIDVIHKNHSFEIIRKDKWWPFLRITNSYNKTKPLLFELGFCRAICKNGMIFGRQSIKVRYYHTVDQIDEQDIGFDFSKLKRMEADFQEQLNNLSRFHVPKKYMLPLTCKALGIEFSEGDLKKPKKAQGLGEFKSRIDDLTNKYFEELEHNAYGALSVITDFASRPSALYISNEAMVSPLQRKSGNWMGEFIAAIKKDDFSFEKYLNGYIEMVGLLNSGGRSD